MCDYVQRKFLIFSNGLLYLLTISSNFYVFDGEILLGRKTITKKCCEGVTLQQK